MESIIELTLFLGQSKGLMSGLTRDYTKHAFCLPIVWEPIVKTRNERLSERRDNNESIEDMTQTIDQTVDTLEVD